MNSYMIQGYTPARVFHFFEDLTKIPHGSGNEAAVADALEAFAKERGLFVLRDQNNNILIKVPATPGREGDRPLLFQGHTDMVCEKNSDTVHDFLHDPLKLCQEGNRLYAHGTTLGGDDGIAVAIMQALCDGEIESHPAYECLFTTEEETGMGGAMAFDYTKLTARHMINLDSEEEDIITVGCAGGIRSDLLLPVTECSVRGTLVRISLQGLCGGHSGAEIHCGRANANRLLGRLLCSLPKEYDLHLVTIEGGSKDNAIPREAEAIVATSDVKGVTMSLLSLFDDIQGEFVNEDKNAVLRCEKLSAEETAAFPAMMDDATTTRALAILTNVPCGVLAMSHDIEGLVEYSRNLGVVRMADGQIKFTFSSRSSKETQLDATVHTLNAFATMAGCTVMHHSRYPGWSYSEYSDVRTAYLDAYHALFNKTPRVDVIHAGLECGYIKEKIPDMDIISVGPNMQAIHSPSETLYLDSVERLFSALSRFIATWH